MEEPAELVLQAEVITRSGSVYRVARDIAGRWWMSAGNIPNPFSVRLDPDRWWEIQPPDPWPPELGERIWLAPPEDMDRGDIRRVPGGGKRTSPVRVIRQPAAARSP